MKSCRDGGGDMEAEHAQGLLYDECMSANGELIDAVWKLLELPGTPFGSARERGILNEVHERRCAIAHGRETPSEAGANVTVAQMEARMLLIQNLTSNWLASATAALASKSYLAA
jgi:hypothetical protein